MKRILILILICIFLFPGCGSSQEQAQIAATTLPVWEFTSRIVSGTGITVTRLVTESVSCLHDYSLNVRQVKAAEAAEVIVVSGAGLEDFMEDILSGKNVIDCSRGIETLECLHDHDHDHDHTHDHDEASAHDHHEEADSHIWLSPANAAAMARNICSGLCDAYPRHADTFAANLSALLADIQALEAYGHAQLDSLTTHDLITFHDGFGYFADAFGLHILEAVEEESGSEASARELQHLIGLVREHALKAIFTETNGSTSAAEVIGRETGVQVYTLDMAMGGDSWFDAMYRNIDTIKEALG